MPDVVLKEWDANIIDEQLRIYQGKGTLSYVRREVGRSRWEVHYWYENQKRILTLRNPDMAQGFIWGLHAGMASEEN